MTDRTYFNNGESFMHIVISRSQAEKLGIVNDARMHELVAACFYLGMGLAQISDIIRRGPQSSSWTQTVEIAIDMGFDPTKDVLEYPQ
jgi:hypothetical protein